ncbi:MAG TPA: enoyl-CoA hydratase [Acidimicrobiales bacterium]|nr:enoyl-CoA hydratase [Acidimicrobiales bacterium]
METLQVERSGGIVTVTFDRPEKKNAINDTGWEELRKVAQDLKDDPSVRCVVLTGAGGDFCSGADVSGGSAEADRGPGDRQQLARMQYIHDVCNRLHDLPMPTIAKVHGVAAGVGLNIALGCDLIVASDEARFSEIFVKRGLSLDGGGSWLLPRLIGLHRAKELALFGDVIDAQEAERLGLVNRVVPAAELDKVVDEWAARLAAGPPIALAMTKRLLNRSFEQSFEQALDDESRTQTVNFHTKDTREALTAFVQKREPKFEGR